MNTLTEVLGNTGLRGRHIDEHHLASEVGGNGLVGGEGGGVVVGGLVGKDENVLLDTTSKDLLGTFVTELLQVSGQCMM